jgi:hypothetical protein
MKIPNTPEELFECLSDEHIYELFPHFDALEPAQQKILQIFNTELTKGKLCDHTFLKALEMVTNLWGYFNQVASLHYENLLEEDTGVAAKWAVELVEANRVNQFIEACIALYGAAPECIEQNQLKNIYKLRQTES